MILIPFIHCLLAGEISIAFDTYIFFLAHSITLFHCKCVMKAYNNKQKVAKAEDHYHIVYCLRPGGVVKKVTESAVKNEFLSHLDEVEAGQRVVEVTVAIHYLHSF